MKTMNAISKVTMLFAFVAFANTLMATGNLKVNLVPMSAEKAVVEISSAAASNFQISISNNKGEVVYYNETDKESSDYRKVFDFSDLENGNYKLSVTVDNQTTERSFDIKNKNLAVGKEKNFMKPFFAYKDGILKLSYLNFSEKNMNVDFYSGNDLVYSHKIDNQFAVNKGFDLSKLDKGSYSVVLSADDKTYTYNVNVE
ncbi:MAG: T9SS type A sorting domain-containing protein [Bacteroidia bacterium]|jgi:uncharacterized membrane protein